MKNITFAGLIAVPLMAFAWAIPASADDAPATTCKDGTTTTSTGKGTCSGHGGVQKASANASAKAAATAPAASTPATVPVQAPPGAPSAVTTCKDGTTSTSSGKGTCSGHGGQVKSSAAKSSSSSSTTTPAAASPATVPVQAPPGAPSAVTTCKDGTTSTSTGKGTCSGHGGQVKSAAPKSAAASTPTPAAESPATVPVQTPAPATGASTTAAKTSTATKSAPTATASNTDPTGATAKCKDGTYSKSQHHSGTCSSHGGVAEWITQ